MILFWFCFLRAGIWLVLKKSLKVMCLKMIIKSCLHPAVFKTVYKNAETGEMVMECPPRRWNWNICQYGSVLWLELHALPYADFANHVLGCSSMVRFHQTDSSVRREAPNPPQAVRHPTLPWHSSHHRWWFKMPFLSRFSAVLVNAITCCGTSAR